MDKYINFILSGWQTACIHEFNRIHYMHKVILGGMKLLHLKYQRSNVLQIDLGCNLTKSVFHYQTSPNYGQTHQVWSRVGILNTKTILMKPE